MPEEQLNLVVSALQSGKLNIEGVDLSDGIDMNDVKGLANSLGTAFGK